MKKHENPAGRLQKLELRAVEIPPELVPKTAGSKATPIQHPAEELLLLIAPVVGVIHVEIRMR